MTKEKFDLKYTSLCRKDGKNIAVQCPTREHARVFINLANSFGYHVYSDSKSWDTYGSQTCYFINFEDAIACEQLSHFTERKLEIVFFELEQSEKETFDIGEVVYIVDNDDQEECVILDLLYVVGKGGNVYSTPFTHEELSRTKPLKKITEEELADMGYMIEK